MHTRHFFCWLELFFKNPRADFCHIAGINCSERGATLIFSLRLLLDSGISVACSLKDRLPRIARKLFPILVQVLCRNPWISSPWGAKIQTGRLRSSRFSSSPMFPDGTKWHETLVFLYTYRLPSANNP
jgi:hypothetical protein